MQRFATRLSGDTVRVRRSVAFGPLAQLRLRCRRFRDAAVWVGFVGRGVEEMAGPFRRRRTFKRPSRFCPLCSGTDIWDVPYRRQPLTGPRASEGTRVTISVFCSTNCHPSLKKARLKYSVGFWAEEEEALVASQRSLSSPDACHHGPSCLEVTAASTHEGHLWGSVACHLTAVCFLANGSLGRLCFVWPKFTFPSFRKT